MTDAGRYVKIVEWSEEDGAFVGQCPGVIGPCCHGQDEADVYRELVQIVEEWVTLLRDGVLTPPTAGRNHEPDRLTRRCTRPRERAESDCQADHKWCSKRNLAGLASASGVRC